MRGSCRRDALKTAGLFKNLLVIKTTNEVAGTDTTNHLLTSPRHQRAPKLSGIVSTLYVMSFSKRMKSPRYKNSIAKVTASPDRSTEMSKLTIPTYYTAVRFVYSSPT